MTEDTQVLERAISTQTEGMPPAVPGESHYNHLMAMAQTFSESELVPAHFQGKKADCYIMLQLAERLGTDPMMLMQNTYMVAGKPGMEGKLVIALVNARGPFKGPIQWEYEGEGNTRKCTAFAIHASTGSRCEASVDVKMAKQMGWWDKKNSFWPKMTDQMMLYRTAVFLARAHCPEVMMGMRTVDELRDIIEINPQDAQPAEPVGDIPQFPSPTADATAELSARGADAPEPEELPPAQDPASLRLVSLDITTFSANVQSAVEVSPGVARAYRDYGMAYVKLPAYPTGLHGIYKDNGASWAGEKETNPSDLKNLSDEVWAKAKEAGYPQPARK